MAAKRKQPTKRQVEKSLVEQLESKGAKLPFFESLVADYMALWKIADDLKSDITKRGVVYKDYSSVGVEMLKYNPSTKELTMVNRQMLSILKELGLSTENCKIEEDDEL